MNQPNAKTTKNRRSLQQLLIEPFKQVKYGLYFIALSFVSFLIIGYTFWASSLKQYNQLMELFNVVGDEKWNVLLNDVFVENMFMMAGVFVVLSLATIAVSIWLTHRVYGPQVALQRFVKEVRSGNYSARIFLRKSDEFHDLADALNTMAEALDKRHGRNNKPDSTNEQLDKAS